MADFYYLVDYIIKFIAKFGKSLNIEQCELRITDYSFKSPQASSYAILIPQQFFQLLKLNSNLIFRNRNIFRAVGNCEIENLNHENFLLKDFTFTLDEFLHINKLPNSIYEETPTDEKRKNSAHMLSLFLNSFVVYHELGHVRQLNYIQNSQEINIEFEIKKENQLKWREQAMEVDADVFALNFLWGDVFYNVKNFKVNDTFSSPKELLLLASYAIFLFFYISNNSHQLNNPYKDHPHPIVRFSILSNYLQELTMTNQLFANNHEFNNFIQTVLKEFDNTLTYHFNLSENSVYYNLFSHPSVREAKEIIQEYIKKDPSLNIHRPYSLP